VIQVQRHDRQPATVTPSLLFFKRFSKSFRWSAVSTIVLVCGIIAFRISQTDKIYAEIQLNDRVEMKFGTNQYYADSVDTRISPLCGCYITRPHRGVKFFTAGFDLSVQDTAFQTPGSLNQFYFFSPFDDMGFNPSLEYSVRYLVVKKDANIDVAHITFQSPVTSLDQASILRDTTISKVQVMTLFTPTDHLTVMTSDSFKVASLTPIKDANITITKLHSPYERENYGFKITEDYDTNKDKRGQWENPSVDVFGPEVKVWVSSGILRVNHQVVLKNLADTSNKLLMIFKVIPQLRILHNRVFSKHLESLLEPTHAIIYYGTKGRLTISSSILGDSEFRELQARYRRHPEIQSPQAMIGPPYEVVTWRLPTIPSCNGIAVYSHDISTLSSNETSGGVSFGISPYMLYPQREVLFKDMTEFKAYNEPMVIPLVDSCSDRTIKFHAKGKLWFDGNTRVNFNTIFNTAIYYLGILSTIMSIVLGIKEIKTWKLKRTT